MDRADRDAEAHPVDGGAVERMIAEHASGARDHAQRLWTLIGLELWLRTYVDRPVPAPVTA